MTTKAKLLAGLVGLVLIWLLMLFFNWDDIEQDVAANASASLQQYGFDWVAVDTDNRGRDVLLTGVSRVSGETEQIKQFALGAEGVRDVDVAAIELRPYQPASLKLDRTGDRLAVSGSLQSAADVEQLRSVLTEKTGLAVEGDVSASVDTEQPAWLSSIDSIAAAIAPVESSSVNIEKGSLTIAGVLRSEAAYDEALDRLAAASGIASVDASGLEVRPFTPPSLQVSRDDEGLLLSGAIDSMARSEQFASALAQDKDSSLKNTIEVNSDVAPAPWADSISAVLTQFASAENGEMKLQENRLEVSGVMRKKADYAALIDQLAKVEGLNVVASDSLSLRPFKSPRFSINSGADSVLGSGVMGDKASAAKLDEAMETVFGAGQSTQILLDADVSEAAWIDDVIRLMPSMTGLDKVSLVATDDGIALSGVARSRAAYDLAASAVADAGEGKISNKIALRPWQQPSLDMATSQDRMEVVGMMPSQQTLEMLDSTLSALGSQLGVPRDTSMAVGDDIQDAPWLESLSAIIPELGILQQPALRAADGVVTVAGIAQSQQDADRVLDLVSTAAGGLMVRTLVKVETPPEPEPEPEPEPDTQQEAESAEAAEGTEAESQQAAVVDYPGVEEADLQRCESELDSKMAGNTIEFEFASAELAPASTGLLNILANAIYSCPDVVIEVGGHTDNVGSDDANNRLSRIRAEAVVEYFEKVGVAAGKLEAQGYGSSAPVGDNETEEGRAMNRRIEFNIKTSEVTGS